jgi:hypothetical protein
LAQLLLPALCRQHQEPAGHRIPRSSVTPSARQTADHLGRRGHPSLQGRPRISRILGRQNHRLPPAGLCARTQPRGVLASALRRCPAGCLRQAISLRSVLGLLEAA